MTESRYPGSATARSVAGLLVLTLLTACAAAPRSTPQPASRPNVVVIFTDDHGWADLGVHGVRNDISTPNVDRLAASGVRFSSGYVTAPQCTPSRAGLLTGRYQQRFGMDDGEQIPLPLDETLLPQRLEAAGYVSGMVGKWHLEPNVSMDEWVAETLPDQLGKPVLERDADLVTSEMKAPYLPNARGFDDTWYGSMREYLVNYLLSGRDVSWRFIRDGRNRIRVQSDAAVAFIERHQQQPFFLYLAYFAPHVPLQAEDEWLARFPDDMPERRRYALAMMSAVDDGVGQVMASLERFGLTDNTLVFFISDNGAPTEMGVTDNGRPVNAPGPFWNGSLNDPLVGEKGMLSEGGIRVPFVMSWPGKLPAGAVYDQPVSTLDVVPTVLAQAGIEAPDELDGVDLLPFLTGQRQDAPHEDLYWRFWGQAAIRSGDWKYLLAGDREFLFQLPPDGVESANLLTANPEKAAELRQRLENWAGELSPAGLPTTVNRPIETVRFHHYFPDR